MRPTWPNLVGVNFIGPYEIDRDYDAHDGVSYGGGAYYTPKGVPAGWINPDDPDAEASGYWKPLALPGEPGVSTGHTIRTPTGVDLPMRAALRFMNFPVNDNGGSNETRVQLPASVVPTRAQLEQVVGAAIPFADIDLTVAANFTATDPLLPPQYALDRGGVVHLRGEVHAGATGEQIIFKMDPLFRPNMTERFPVCKHDGSATFVRAEPDGNVYVTGTAGEDIHLDGVNFASEIAFGGVPTGLAPHFINDWNTGDPEMMIRGVVIAGRMTGFGDGVIAFTFDKPFQKSFPEVWTYDGVAEIVGGGDPVHVNLDTYEFDDTQLELTVNWAAGDTPGSPVVLAGRIV